MLELDGTQHRKRRSRMLVRMLHRNLRMTDQKGFIGKDRYGILLVDTPEMGGRSVMDRLTQLAHKHGLQITMKLKVHDPDGFSPDEDQDSPGDGMSSFDEDLVASGRRRGDDQNSRWLPVAGEVEVTTEDPIVGRPAIRMAAKRTLDIVGASVGLILTGPVVLAAMYAIRRQDGGSPIFTQTREGLRGKPFTIFKLRTMVINAEASQAELRSQSHRDGPAFKISHDPRVTKVGQFLRKTCIDELPQLWNVLIGDMSLVGPRPLPWHESRACVPWHRRRLDVRPGMTCYWQVEKDKVETFDDWMRLDLRYLEQVSILEDLRLIAKTVVVPMTGRGSE
ncbi:putative sugar transferase EpsL [Rubripirellula amarantea]|uniref:Putative sugar transferase EpsL n=2 Tax=Rubripirellula amarantea TaxID=2527999 RepID=A0A5C5WNV7_9BACT|nr:putative sugar transferase EpsL [Rubripirellula amarantea]